MTVSLNLNRSSSVPLPTRPHTAKARNSHKKKKKGFLSRVFGKSLDEEAMNAAFDQNVSRKEDERGTSFGSDSTTGSVSASSLERLNKGFMSSPRRGMLGETLFESLESFHRKLRACKTQVSYCAKLSRSQSLFTAHVRSVRARSARISLFSFTHTEYSLVSLTQPTFLSSFSLSRIPHS